MLDAVLRIYGHNFDVDPFLENHPELESSGTFKKGELDMFGNPNEFSGCDVVVAEQRDAETCLYSLHQLLLDHQDTFIELKEKGMQSILDVDVTVEGDEQMPDSFVLPVEVLGALAALNIAVEFSAYPSMHLN
jgi:hypothetical protein